MAEIAFTNHEKMTFPASLTVIHCGQCAGIYAINERYRQKKHEEGGSWNCPYCQTGWGYSGNSENERLKRDLESKQRALEAKERHAEFLRERAARAERSAIAQRGVSTRIKNRVAKGVCPCCNRHFKDLHRHMQGQHPDYTKQDT